MYGPSNSEVIGIGCLAVLGVVFGIPAMCYGMYWVAKVFIVGLGAVTGWWAL
jgi:hypothetical protein